RLQIIDPEPYAPAMSVSQAACQTPANPYVTKVVDDTAKDVCPDWLLRVLWHEKRSSGARPDVVRPPAASLARLQEARKSGRTGNSPHGRDLAESRRRAEGVPAEPRQR